PTACRMSSVLGTRRHETTLVSSWWFRALGCAVPGFETRLIRCEVAMDSLSRRHFLALAAVPPMVSMAQAPRAASMLVCMHETSSDGFDFKTAMEGYAKAGIRAVEPSLLKVREFAQKESPARARRLLDDLGLRAVSSSNQLGLIEPGEQRAASLEQLKWKV